jgi:Flp pilus assembly protein TadD
MTKVGLLVALGIAAAVGAGPGAAAEPTNAAASGAAPPAKEAPAAAADDAGDPAALPDLQEGYYQMRVGDSQGAADAFRRALRLDPKNKRAMFGLGTALIALQEYAEAQRVLAEAMAAYPRDYYIRNNLAWLYATSGDVRLRDGRKAVALAQEALLMAPQDYHVWSTLAEAYYISGKYEQAVRAAGEAHRLARAQGVDEAVAREYTRQLEKCRQAVQAMTILE